MKNPRFIMLNDAFIGFQTKSTMIRVFTKSGCSYEKYVSASSLFIKFANFKIVLIYWHFWLAYPLLAKPYRAY